MSKQQEIQQKSRLGTLLLHKGLINRRQLDEALKLQASSKLMLGEVMIQQGWLTERQLKQVLKNQSRYRLVAAVGAVLLGPLQPFMATANASIEQTQMASQAELEKRVGMKSLDEMDMGDITAQGLQDNVAYLTDVINGDASDENATESATMAMFESVLPGLNLLTDYEISGVEYYEDGPVTTLNADGSLSVQVPKRIAEIAFRDINVRGSNGPAMGDLIIKDLRMTPESSITLRLHQ
ncbi:MAG: hypothetical protein CSH36_01750 [Thalassolituus sp.]|jgi:hypothetical protein|uniref:hypothetical protein n=2 Tax=Thalassolituus TaxID=187492 RepID=UPI002617CFF9|nr:hypothetical protein [uncultured Thalassolituus sp.]TNC92975.1 MAG: hypothetical protein CSH36_01750 [Thalassolituus sp.]